MNRIAELFIKKKKEVLNIYCTAGFPYLEATMEVVRSLQDNGVDLVEIGIPYSDPLADGPVIQQSNARALENGMTIRLLFRQLKELRPNIHIPVILMGYLNPVLQYGIREFCVAAKEAGVDGVIMPDLPMYEFEKEYKPFFADNNLAFIFLVTPETCPERIRKIDALSTGFIYAVSSSSTTGSNADPVKQQVYFQKLQDMQLQNPVLIGFGISNRASFLSACQFSNGAIIGSAYISALKNAHDIENCTKEFVSNIRG